MQRPTVPSAATGGNEGIGLRLNGMLIVQEVVTGGPAHACGVIDVGDQLLSIDGLDVSGKKPAEISHLIVGPQGSTIDICIKKKVGGAKVPIKLHRGTQAPGGVGMKLQRNDADELVVEGVQPNGAADVGGVQVKDILVTINGKSILGLTVRDVVPLIAGPERTKLDLAVVRGESRAQVKLTLIRVRKGDNATVAYAAVAAAEAKELAEAEALAAKKGAEEEARQRAEEERLAAEKKTERGGSGGGAARGGGGDADEAGGGGGGACQGRARAGAPGGRGGAHQG